MTAAGQPSARSRRLLAVFDLDGTLLDSDEALCAAYVELGIPRESVTYGHVVADECARLGLSLDDYVAAYDPTAAVPFPGVEAMLAGLTRWAVCSNKDRRSGVAELARLGWEPSVAQFAQDFGGGPKRLGPVLDALGLDGSDVLFVGDSPHDALCAAEAGARFAVAAWNPRTRALGLHGDVVLRSPSDLPAALG
jgi:HAD superfamily hydrolase (TIGR01549 family)